MNKKYAIFTGAMLALAASMSASDAREREFDYAPSAAPTTEQVFAGLPINPAGINVVSGNLGDYQSDFSNAFMNHMSLWLTAKQPGPNSIVWELDVPEAGVYAVDAVAAGKGSVLSLTCNDQKQGTETELTNGAGFGWDRVSLGMIELKAGQNTLQLDVEAAEKFKFDALELIQPAVKEASLKEALAMRKKPDWFKNSGYGLMFQWTNRATPPEGSIKPWEEKVNDFDLDGFIKLVEESGAAYVMWSITWGEQYLSAPIGSLDAIIQGRTTQRDLLGEMADELAKRDVKLVFYYHYGYDCNHSIDTDWMEASGGYKADKTQLYRNWLAIITEIGERYGDKLHGWWFDGGQRFYNCHFDNTPGNEGILSAPFKYLTKASRAGNPDRIVSYNSWIKPRLTEYQDFYGGEGARSFSNLVDGSFTSGPKKGLQAHGCFILEKEWGHIKENTPIPSPRFNLNDMVKMVEKAQRLQYALSINLQMYEDGSVSPESAELLRQLKAATREQ